MRPRSLAAALYSRLMDLRATIFELGLSPRWKAPVPCISVGNIRWGGTGKTPLCQWLLGWAQEQGLRPALLTRGYRARPPFLPFHVRPDSPVDQAGDEPLLLARSTPQARIIVDPRRIRSGPWAWRKWRPDLFVLDDGFQHLAVQRDLNLVLLIPQDLDQDWNQTIPRGPWREGAQALHRADAFLLKTFDPLTPRLKRLMTQRLAGFAKPVFLCFATPRGLTNLISGEHRLSLPDAGYALVSGIANPFSLERTAQTLLQALPVRHFAFADHHEFSLEDLSRIIRQAGAQGIKHLICTAKDATKIQPLLAWNPEVQWWSLEMELGFAQPGPGQEDFATWLRRRMQALSGPWPAHPLSAPLVPRPTHPVPPASVSCA